MAGGWTRDGAVQDQIDASVDEAVRRARDSLGRGESLANCEECEQAIPLARQRALPGVRLCVNCQEEVDGRQERSTTMNRRGSKDSQLR